MKKIGIIVSFLFLTSVSIQPIYAQDDETRQATGLPMMIGRNSTNRSVTALSGRITIQGADDQQVKPSLFVVVYQAGAVIDRRQVTDSGNYYVPSVPREGTVISVELGGTEIGRYQLPPSIAGNVRYDITLTWAELQRFQNKPAVISAKNLYLRTDRNQKLFEKASSAAKEKNTEKAIEFYKQLMKEDPKDFVALTELGTLYFKAEKYSDAREFYDKALEQNPSFAVAQVNSGKLYLAQKAPEKAIEVLTKAVENEPNSADAQHFLGEAYLQVKKGSKAVIYLNEALKLAPIEKAEIHLRLAQLYNGANLKNKAAEEYKLFLGKVPDYKEKDKLEKYIKDNSPE